MKDKLYEEVGHNYRFYVKLRQAGFVGNLVVVWAVIVVLTGEHDDAFESLLWLVPLVLSGVPLSLWATDIRTRHLFELAIEAGKALEQADGHDGFYSRLVDFNTRSVTRATVVSRFALRGLMPTTYVGAFLLLLTMSAITFFKT